MDAVVLKAICTSVAGRYARALFEVANEHDALLQTEQSCLLAKSLFGRQSPHRLLAIRLLQGSFPQAEARFLDVAGFSDFFWRFLKLLAQYDRLDALKDITRLFSSLVDEALGRVSLTVFSADPLTARQRTQLNEQLQTLFQKQLSLTYILDPRLLGGIKVQSNQLTLDASVRHHIEQFIKEAKEAFVEREEDFWRTLKDLEK